MARIKIIKEYIFFFYFVFCGLAHAQTTESKVEFGKPVTKEIELQNRYHHIYDIILQKLPSSKSRNYFNNNDLESFESSFKDVKNANVTWVKNDGDNKKYTITLPALMPNRFYRIKVNYLSSESIFAAYLMMHTEKNDSWYTQKKEWMKLIDRISENNGDFSLTYDPSLYELNKFKLAISHINLETFTEKVSGSIDANITDLKIIAKKREEIKTKKDELQNKQNELLNELKRLLLKEFEVLNFADVKDKIEKKNIIEFCDSIQKNIFNETTFSSVLIDAIDYPGIYGFYEKHLVGAFNDKEIKGVNLVNLINKKIVEEKNNYTGDNLIPNHLSSFEALILQQTRPISTYPLTFETSYKLSLVPDFGYITYLGNTSNTPQGGSLFVGVNVSLSPVNKNVPLKISKLNLKQRLAIHTGLTLNSVKKENVSDDFFSNYSLIIGGSYKVLTQGTRVNFGGLFYNKLNPINSTKSVAIQPYIGLSIDLEIRTWLQSLFPNIK